MAHSARDTLHAACDLFEKAAWQCSDEPLRRAAWDEEQHDSPYTYYIYNPSTIILTYFAISSVYSQNTTPKYINLKDIVNHEAAECRNTAV